jgi:hypothetical protein
VEWKQIRKLPDDLRTESSGRTGVELLRLQLGASQRRPGGVEPEVVEDAARALGQGDEGDDLHPGP